jgi:hypothetical protein
MSSESDGEMDIIRWLDRTGISSPPVNGKARKILTKRLTMRGKTISSRMNQGLKRMGDIPFSFKEKTLSERLEVILWVSDEGYSKAPRKSESCMTNQRVLMP